MKYSFGYEHHAMWLKISNATKAIMAYALIALGTAFIFWDDIFRGSLPALMPYTKVPAVIGAFSPAVASIMIRTCINWETFPTSRLPWIPFKKFSYYLFAGFLPSMIILLIIFLVTGF